MYHSSNTLNYRPRGFSTNAAVQEAPSILPQFLRRLSSRAPDSYDRAEKMMNGNNILGNGHRRSGSVIIPGVGMRGRIFKILVVILILLTAVYFFLPWAPSLAPFGILS
jgi:hypothetical protein